MKTRVTEHFDTKLGIYCYWVWKWDLWDAPDLRAAYPHEYDWRHVIYLPDKERCMAIARQLAEPERQPEVSTVEIAGMEGPQLVPLIAEFGQ